jgi:bifunctional DNA-binding transcriptional regulator/antitoxin component of YhaV-PrlF toxin-antitoxin module
MSEASKPAESFEAVVNDAGDLVVPAEQVEGLGLHAGDHLAVVVPIESVKRPPFQDIQGAGAELVPELSWEDFEEASQAAIAEAESAAERKGQLAADA